MASGSQSAMKTKTSGALGARVLVRGFLRSPMGRSSKRSQGDGERHRQIPAAPSPARRHLRGPAQFPVQQGQVGVHGPGRGEGHWMENY